MKKKKYLTVLELAEQFVNKVLKPLEYKDEYTDFDRFDGLFKNEKINNLWRIYTICARINKIIL